MRERQQCADKRRAGDKGEKEEVGGGRGGIKMAVAVAGGDRAEGHPTPELFPHKVLPEATCLVESQSRPKSMTSDGRLEFRQAM